MCISLRHDFFSLPLIDLNAMDTMHVGNYLNVLSGYRTSATAVSAFTLQLAKLNFSSDQSFYLMGAHSKNLVILLT